MRILVIGASGFIGSRILAEARAAGYPAEGTSARGSVGLHRFALGASSLEAALPGDVLNADCGLAVVLAAFLTDMDFCRREPEHAREINVGGVCRLADEVAALGGKVIFLSTGHVYDGLTGRYREIDPVAPVNTYARHKLEVENHILHSNPQAFVARLDKVVGTSLAGHHLLSDWFWQVRSGEPIRCVEGMEISPTSVDDVAGALLMAAGRDLCGVFNIAGPDAVDRAEYARRFCDRAGTAHPVHTSSMESFSFGDRRALKSSLCGERFFAATGMKFSNSEEILNRFFENAGRP